MKHLAIVILFCISAQTMNSQLEADNLISAWERTVFTRWDEFKPAFFYWWAYNKFKKDDKRTIHARTANMYLWSMYADQYELHSTSVDSVLRQETIKAADKIINKNYILLQRPRELQMYEAAEKAVLQAIDDDIPEKLYTLVEEEVAQVQRNIAYLAQTYAPDAEKQPLIEVELKRLESIVMFALRAKDFAFLFEEDKEIEFATDLSDVLELNKVTIEKLIIE